MQIQDRFFLDRLQFPLMPHKAFAMTRTGLQSIEQMVYMLDGFMRHGQNLRLRLRTKCACLSNRARMEDRVGHLLPNWQTVDLVFHGHLMSLSDLMDGYMSLGTNSQVGFRVALNHGIQMARVVAFE